MRIFLSSKYVQISPVVLGGLKIIICSKAVQKLEMVLLDSKLLWTSINPCMHVGEQSHTWSSAWSCFTGQHFGTPGGGRQWQAASRDMNRRLVGVCCCTGTGQRRSPPPTARPCAKTHAVLPNDVVPRYKKKESWH